MLDIRHRDWAMAADENGVQRTRVLDTTIFVFFSHPLLYDELL